MVVTCSRARLLYALLLIPVLNFPALPFQAELNGPNVRIVPTRSREAGLPKSGTGDSSFPEATLRIDSSLVLIPAQVTTREGSPIMDLRPKDFRIYEDGAEQEISYFAKDDAPVSIGLLLDSSGSMKNKKQKSSEAAAAFFRTANSEDEFVLIEFDERPKLAVPFTRDTDLLYHEITHTRPYGRTSLFDAIHMAVGVMKAAHHDRKALVIVSDGGDNRSRHTFTAIKSDMLEADVQVYAMGIFDPEGAAQTSREESEGPDLLDHLADLTGGRHFPVLNLGTLPEVSTKIGQLLRNRYLLGYNPTNASRDGRYRGVKLDLAAPSAPGLHVQYRKGYYAPQQ
jgi:Ca-activated chloride channel family protein